MPLYSSSTLKSLSQNTPSPLFESYSRERKSINSKFDIFLSHCYLDYDEVKGLYIDLTRLGFVVYVDWIIDPYLDRNNVTKSTANLIRNRMKNSSTLLLAISQNSQNSKWIPWELGYMDGKTQKCAIIPVSRDAVPEKVFYGQEFLSLYPFIKKLPDTSDKERLWVIEEAYKYVRFDSWFGQGTLPYVQSTNIFNL